MTCIILVRVLDSKEGGVCPRFFDMPIGNIGNTQNLFAASKTSLSKNGFDFSKAMAFFGQTQLMC